MGSNGKAAALLFIAAVAAYFPLLAPETAPFSAYSDILAFHIGYKDVLASGLLEHRLPLWRTDQMLGGPALAQPQALFLHPLHALFFWLPSTEAFGPTLVLSLWIGALGAYALARQLGTSFRSALLAGVAQLVCFKLIMVCYAGWASQLASLVLLPWVLAAWLRYVERRSLSAFLGLSGSLFVALAGGSPQVLYYLLLILLALPFVSESPSSLRVRAQNVLHCWAALCLACLFALAANGYLWLPILADLPLLSRAEQSLDFFYSGHRLGLAHLATLLHPEWLGSPLDGTYPGVELWEDVAYFGLIPLLFVLGLAVRHSVFSAQARFLLLAFLVTLTASLATPFLSGLHAFVPGYALFRLPGRMLFITALLGIALFALSVDRLLLYISTKRPQLSPLVFVVLFLSVLGEGTLYARAYLTTLPAAHLHPDADHPARGLSSKGRARAAIVGRGSLNYAWAQNLDLDIVNGGDAYLYRHVRAYLALVEHNSLEAQEGPWLDLRSLKRPDLLRDLAVEYVLSMRPLALPELVLIHHTPRVRNFVLYKGEREAQLFVYRLADARPRARLVREVERVDSLESMAQRLKNESQRDRALIVRDATSAQLTAAAPTDRDSVTELERSSDRFTLRVATEGVRFLLLSEAYHPGFRATIDGIEAPLLQTNLALLGLWVPPGEHRVDIWYWPTSLTLGVLSSCLSALLWLLLALYAQRHNAFVQRFLATARRPQETPAQ